MKSWPHSLSAGMATTSGTWDINVRHVLSSMLKGLTERANRYSEEGAIPGYQGQERGFSGGLT